MKIFKRIVWGVFIFVAVFYLLPVGLLQIPYLQKKISHKIAADLTNKFQTEVQIGQIEVGFLNKIILKDVYLEDRSQDTLLEAKRLTANFDILPLFKKKWRIHSIQLYTFQFNLSKETHNSPLNIQYILDIFANPDSTTNNPIDLQIENINLRTGSFSYREKDVPGTPGQFNPQSFQLNDIASKIKVRDFKSDQILDVIVKQLSFKENNGFKVKQLAFDLKAGKEKAVINQLLLKLENTSLTIKDIEAHYSENPEFKDTAFQLKIDNSDIYLKDFGTFIPALSQFDDKINIDGDFSGTPDNLTIQNLCFRYYNHLMIKTNARIRNLFDSNPETVFIDGQIGDSFLFPIAIERIMNNFRTKPFELPPSIRQMKSMNFRGNITGNPNNLSANGTLDSETGILVTNITLATKSPNGATLKGQIASPKLNLAALTGNHDYGQTIFDIEFDIKQQADKKFAGSIDGHVEKFEYKDHSYNNLNLKGDFTPESFNGLLNLDNPEGKISAEGLFLLKGADSEFKFTAKVTDLQLDKLNLTRKYNNASLSFEADAHLTGNNPDNLLGVIQLSNIHFGTAKGNYDLNKLTVTSIPSGNEKTLSIQSELLQGEICGTYSFGTFVPEIKKTLSLYLPALFETNKKSSVQGENIFSFDLTIEDMTHFSRILELPFTLREQTRITGQYNSVYDKFNLDADIHNAQFGGSTFENMKITLNNPAGEALLNLSAASLQKNNRTMPFAVRLNAADDRVKTQVKWGNISEKYRGDLSLNTLFSKAKGKSLYTQIDIKQSNLVFNDSLWTLYPTQIQADSSTIKINHLLAAHNDQFLKIDGAISHNPEEKLLLELNKVDLEYIFNSLNIKALEFGGIATGFVNVQDIYKTRKLSTQLDVKKFAFNQVTFGDLDLTGKWDDNSQGVLMNGFVWKNDSTHVAIDGIIYPVKELISIDFDAKNTDARFLRKYLDKIVRNLTGEMTGRLRLFGNLNDPAVEGTVYAKNCRFGVEFLNTYYTFSDTIHCYADEIRAENIHLFDEKGQMATANGYVKHNLFDDFKFSANVSFDNLLIFNANKTKNPLFYGTAYGTGTASLYGTEDLVNIDVAMRNTENTKITMNFMDEPDIVDYDFIRFVQPKKDTIQAKTANPSLALNNNSSNSNSGTEIRLNLMLEANQQSTIEIMLDPISGDKISGYGNGNMQVQYGTKTPLKVLGTYTIERGKYNFSLQQVIYRNFDIREGSTVAFRGDPYAAELNVKANYRLTANLGDLDQQLIADQPRNNTTVNCILQLTGQLQHPAIAFDLDLPNSTPELNRQVKSYMRTEDMMNRQIFYLLVLNTFYTYEGNNARNRNDMSLLTSTLSTQLSNILDAFTDKIQLVGTKFNQSTGEGGSSTEMEFLLSSQLLNNRLIINGNFGYRDSPYLGDGGQSNNIHWIGDFDLEYKLTQRGDIRLKFFNRYNYRNYYNLTPEMTQGLGILFRKDFNRFSNLFGKKNNLLPDDTTTVK